MCAVDVCGQRAFERGPELVGLYLPGQIAQPVSSSAARRTLAGTVVNSATGEPIRRALVRVNGAEAHSAFTSGNGRFEIPNILEGRISLSVQKPGFFEDEPQSAASQPQPGGGSWTFYTPSSSYSFDPRNISFTLGPTTGEIVLKLAPEARIKGRILDENGEPIENVIVQSLERQAIEGQNRWLVRGSSTTDDTGSYLLDELRPGTYAIRNFALESEVPSAAKEEKREKVYPARYYPNAPDLSSVQPFVLSAGQEISANFALQAVMAYQVSGVLAGVQDGANVLCEDAEGQAAATQSYVDPKNGRFTVSGITSGAWVLHAIVRGRQVSDFAEAYLPIEVGALDISGLVLRPQRLPTIPVNVQNGSGGQQAIIELIATSGIQARRYQANHEPGDLGDGVAFHAIAPGKYRALARVNGGSDCIGSILSGGVDLMRDTLIVAAGSQPAAIEVTLTSECASLSGSVVSGAEQPTGVYLVLSGDSAAVSTALPLGADRRFCIPNLTPGSYRLFAFSDISGLEYANSEAMRDFSGVDISVGANEKRVVRLELTTRSH